MQRFNFPLLTQHASVVDSPARDLVGVTVLDESQDSQNKRTKPENMRYPYKGTNGSSFGAPTMNWPMNLPCGPASKSAMGRWGDGSRLLLTRGDEGVGNTPPAAAHKKYTEFS